jgi:membrane dipeptidase
MKRRQFVQLGAATPFLSTLSLQEVPMKTVKNKAIRLDLHTCMPLRENDETFLPQLIRHQEAGFDAVCINVGFDALDWEKSPILLANYRNFVLKNADKFQLISSYADFALAKKQGKLGVFFDIEGGKALNDHIGMVEVYQQLGVRWMLLVYNNTNTLGGGCMDEVDPGLTVFGKQVISKMAEVGIILCCTHCGYKTAAQAIDLNPNPSIFSHSNPRALHDHPRNIPDELMQRCADKGGVVGINGIGIFLGDNVANPEIIVKHIDYAVQKIGIEHVGLGLDYVFDKQELDDFLEQRPDIFPPDKFSKGINMVTPEMLPEISNLLARKGYKSSDLDLVFGENWLRVMKRVWK